MGKDERLTPTELDFSIYNKYFGDVKDNSSIITDIAMNSKSSVDMGAVAAVLGGSNIDFNKYKKLNTATNEEIISCMKVFMYNSPSNPNRFLKAIARSLINPDRVTLNTFLKESMPLYCVGKHPYNIPNRNPIAWGIMSKKNLFSEGQLESLQDIFGNFVGTAQLRLNLGSGSKKDMVNPELTSLYSLEGDGINFILSKVGEDDSSETILKVNIETGTVDTGTIAVSSKTKRVLFNELWLILDRLSKLPITIEKLYFYSIDPFSTYKFNPKWIYGFYEVLNADEKVYNVLLI